MNFISFFRKKWNDFWDELAVKVARIAYESIKSMRFLIPVAFIGILGFLIFSYIAPMIGFVWALIILTILGVAVLIFFH